MMLRISTKKTAPVGVIPLGMVKGSCVLTDNILQDYIMAAKEVVVGGELKWYTALIDKAIDVALERLQENAKSLGAVGVYNIRFYSVDNVGQDFITKLADKGDGLFHNHTANIYCTGVAYKKG